MPLHDRVEGHRDSIQDHFFLCHFLEVFAFQDFLLQKQFGDVRQRLFVLLQVFFYDGVPFVDHLRRFVVDVVLGVFGILPAASDALDAALRRGKRDVPEFLAHG